MARSEPAQLNIRSRFARERVAMLARQTGLTAVQVVEEALRAFQPPTPDAVAARLVRKGAILVKPRDGAGVTLAEAEAALGETRAGVG